MDAPDPRHPSHDPTLTEPWGIPLHARNAPKEPTLAQTTAPSLTSLPWWRELAQRMYRQAVQTAAPILTAVVLAGPGDIDPATVGYAIASAVAVTVAKFGLVQITQIKPADSARPWVRLLDRVGPAVAGVVLGVPVSGLSDVLSVDWAQVGYVAVAAGALAALAAKVDPASTSDPGPALNA